MTDLNPQIYLGLLVGLGGYTIGYDIFEGKTYEGHTLIPFIEKMCKKFNLQKPIVIADSGLLSKENIKALEEKEYEYIIGAHLRNEQDKIKEQILQNKYIDESTISIEKAENKRLIVSYSSKRAVKDVYNRKRGLNRLEKQIKSNKLTKSNINNKGYNKYLELERILYNKKVTLSLQQASELTHNMYQITCSFPTQNKPNLSS